MHAHTWEIPWTQISSPESLVISQGALIDGMQSMCTRLGGDAFIDGDLSRSYFEGMLLYVSMFIGRLNI